MESREIRVWCWDWFDLKLHLGTSVLCIYLAPVGRLVAWSLGRLVGWSVDWSAGRLVGYVGCFVLI